MDGRAIKLFKFCFMRKIYSLLLVGLLAAFSGFTQTTFTSTPVTTATVGSAYSYSLGAVTNTNNPVTFSAVGTLPSFLTLNSSGQSQFQQIGGSIPYISAVAHDPSTGNLYTANHADRNINKITPNGTTSVFAQLPTNGGQPYGGALVLGNYFYVTLYAGGAYADAGLYRFDLTQSNPTGQQLISGANLLGITHKDGYIYAADYIQGSILKYSIANNTSEVLVSGFQYPFGVGFTLSGDLLISLLSSGSMLKYSPGTSTGGSLTTVLSSLPIPTDIKVDAAGNNYVSFYGAPIRKYSPDFSSFVSLLGTVNYVWGMSLSSSGVLCFGDYGGGIAYQLQTGTTLSGTPALADIGVHPISINATDGTTTANQSFSLSVYGPATLTSFPNLTKYQAQPPFTLTAPTSNSNGAFTYTSSNTSVATVSGNTVTIVGVGTATITATQAAAGLYLETSTTATLTVLP